MARNNTNYAGGRKVSLSVSRSSIIIPLNVPADFPSDYIRQTANILSKTRKVILFDFRYPLSIWHLLIHHKKRQLVMSQYRAMLDDRMPRGVFLIPAFGLLPLQRFSFIYKANIVLGIFCLSLFIVIFLREPIVLWGFHPMLALLLRKFWTKAVVYDCVDYYGEEKEVGRKHRDMEEKVFEKATLLSFNSKALYETKLSESPNIREKSIIVPCGCDVDSFRGHKTISSNLQKIPHPRIGFVGHMNHRIDFNLLSYLVNHHRFWSFVFIGPVLIKQPEDVQTNVETRILDLRHHGNVYLLGEKPKASLPGFVAGMDVCIIPYNTKYKKVLYCNPMKAYEYLASGKPVVSTDIYALRELHTKIIIITTSHRAFSRAINSCLNHWTKHDAKSAVQIAVSQSWDQKIAAIAKGIRVS